MELIRPLGLLAVLLVGTVVVGALFTLVVAEAFGGPLGVATALVVAAVTVLAVVGVVAGARGAGRTHSPYW